MPTFLQSQAAFGPPAEAPFIEQPVELEAQAEAYRKKADLSYSQGLGLPSTPYVSRTVTDPDTPTLDEKYYKLAQSNYQEQVSEIMKDVEASGEKLTPELKSRLIQFKQKKNALSQEGGLYDILGQRKERYSTALETLEKSEANDERKKQFKEMLDDSFTKSGLGTDFYVPPIIESTKYTNQILKIANDISTIDTKTVEGKRAFNAYITTIPGLPSEKFLLKETQLTDIKTPERIAAVIQAYINANPDIKTDIKADTDYNAWREVNYLKSVSNPNSEYYDPNYQYDKEKGLFYDQNTNTTISKDEIRQQHFQQKVNALAGLGAEAEKTWKYKESLQLGTDLAKRAALVQKIIAESQLTIPKTNEIGKVEETTLNQITNFNFDKNGQLTAGTREPSEIFKKAVGKMGAFPIFEPVSKEQQEKEINELYRKHPEVKNISKTPYEFITNLNKALRTGPDQAEGKYETVLPEKLLSSNWIKDHIENLAPVDKDNKAITNPETLTALKKSLDWTLGPEGTFETILNGEKYSLTNIPLEIKGMLRFVGDVYQTAQNVWLDPGRNNIQTVNLPEIREGKLEINPLPVYTKLGSDKRYNIMISDKPGKEYTIDEYLQYMLIDVYKEIKDNPKLNDLFTDNAQETFIKWISEETETNE